VAKNHSSVTERVYKRSGVKGYRVLVDALWPRGVSKDKADVDEWLKDVAPSDKLRRWFAHDPAKWDEFRARYQQELSSEDRKAAFDKLVSIAKKERSLVLVYAAKDEEHNNAIVVKEALEELLKQQ
jgi:uncharacterized protein YeaO (DUF488 family)